MKAESPTTFINTDRLLFGKKVCAMKDREYPVDKSHFRSFHCRIFSSPGPSHRDAVLSVLGVGATLGQVEEGSAALGEGSTESERARDTQRAIGGDRFLCCSLEIVARNDNLSRDLSFRFGIGFCVVSYFIGLGICLHAIICIIRESQRWAGLCYFMRNSVADLVSAIFSFYDTSMWILKSSVVAYYTAWLGISRGAGEKRTAEVDAVVGADGANSRVAKSIGAGEYEYAIAFQERVKIPESKMEYYKERAEMYVGDDVSPDFYGWVFPKCDHVAVGTGTVTHKTDIKKFQAATRLRAKDKIEGGTIIRVEAHPIPEHPRPRRVLGRVALVGDAAGYVTKCSGEGIYFAAKSGRMCAEAIVEGSENGSRMIEESDLRKYLAKFDKMYWPTYKVLDVLQKVFYRSNAAREAFVEMCADEYVQKMTFDSYLYKKVVPGNPLDDLKLAVNTIGSLVRANALRREMDKITL
ncbi:hypothetical protein ZIOFF_007654 [Zingiber officinale]|uniref:Geranylgeranyl diphosphate reductase, chloroplastic n=1 Tax=Zingiber officinale TaxID=94328 RepID=A0A8J5IGU5_ZINOF|nr:hypothetical protein ZIOFF_007654 [Zingiber officinale]